MSRVRISGDEVWADKIMQQAWHGGSGKGPSGIRMKTKTGLILSALLYRKP